MSQDQIRKDLNNRIVEKLTQWSTDAVDLYAMGGLAPGVAVTDLANALVQQLALTVSCTNLSLEQHAQANARALRQVKEKLGDLNQQPIGMEVSQDD